MFDDETSGAQMAAPNRPRALMSGRPKGEHPNDDAEMAAPKCPAPLV